MTAPPLWAAWLVVALAVFGAALAMVGALGLLRMRSFYDRAHPATLAATMGATSIVLASLLHFSFAAGRLLPKAFLVAVFIPLVSPVTTMLLARAALARDRSQAFGARPPQTPEDAEWQRKAALLAEAQAEAARRPVEESS